jgi:hypothetical protein
MEQTMSELSVLKRLTKDEWLEAAELEYIEQRRGWKEFIWWDLVVWAAYEDLV